MFVQPRQVSVFTNVFNHQPLMPYIIYLCIVNCTCIKCLWIILCTIAVHDNSQFVQNCIVRMLIWLIVWLFEPYSWANPSVVHWRWLNLTQALLYCSQWLMLQSQQAIQSPEILLFAWCLFGDKQCDNVNGFMTTKSSN